jgi:hypothetical protein
VDREIALCGRARNVLRRQLALREVMVRAGKIDHELVFFQEDGSPIIGLSYPYDRWRYVLESRHVRYRDSYNARHSYISWRLMIGHNVLLLVAEEDGHSVATMLGTYAAWTKGVIDADLAAIKCAMERSPQRAPSSSRILVPTPRFSGAAAPWRPRNLPPEGGWGHLSWRNYSQRTGGADGTRTRDPRRDRPVF